MLRLITQANQRLAIDKNIRATLICVVRIGAATGRMYPRISLANSWQSVNIDVGRPIDRWSNANMRTRTATVTIGWD